MNSRLYACLYCVQEDGEEFDATLFPLADGDAPLAHTVALATKLNKKHQYTDTAHFTLRCLVCKEGAVPSREV